MASRAVFLQPRQPRRTGHHRYRPISQGARNGGRARLRESNLRKIQRNGFAQTRLRLRILKALALKPRRCCKNASTHRVQFNAGSCNTVHGATNWQLPRLDVHVAGTLAHKHWRPSETRIADKASGNQVTVDSPNRNSLHVRKTVFFSLPLQGGTPYFLAKPLAWQLLSYFLILAWIVLSQNSFATAGWRVPCRTYTHLYAH